MRGGEARALARHLIGQVILGTLPANRWQWRFMLFMAARKRHPSDYQARVLRSLARPDRPDTSFLEEAPALPSRGR